MRHGHHIPKHVRPAWARRALEILRASPNRNQALFVIAAEFSISNSTARNLISYGHFLEREQAQNAG
jgi:hypothetical protein